MNILILILLNYLINCGKFELNLNEKMLSASHKLLLLTPDVLSLAAIHGNVSRVRECLDNGVNANYLSFHGGSTPLILAVNQGSTLFSENPKHSEEKSKDYEEIVIALVSHGVDIEIENQKNNTALFYALSKNNKKTTSILLSAGAMIKKEYLNQPKYLKLLQEVMFELFNSSDVKKVNEILENMYNKLNIELFNLLMSDQELKEKTLEIIGSFDEDKKRGIEEKILSNEKVKELFAKSKLIDGETQKKESIKRMVKLLSE